METNLKDIGFTGHEEKVYVALLRLGPSTTGLIAKEAGVSRSKLYEILERLTRKGIVSHYRRNNVMVFAAAPPERILDYIQKKEEALERQKVLFTKSLPFFNSLLGNRQMAREAQVFEGMEGIKNVRETALQDMKKGDVMYYFGNSASGHQHMLGYWDDWNKRRVKKKEYGLTSYTTRMLSSMVSEGRNSHILR